ncbi:hypothetical protein B0H11DRAFT_1918087 [Mycena galericulata]|nr:hypothetical protein B0H11DRAFT_1918087 [Mycena galericulata]
MSHGLMYYVRGETGEFKFFKLQKEREREEKRERFRISDFKTYVPTDPIIAGYLKPFTTDMEIDKAVRTIIRKMAPNVGLLSFTPKTRDGAAPECVICKLDNHLAYLCPFTRATPPWWGPPDQLSHLIGGILGRSPRGGDGGGGGPPRGGGGGAPPRGGGGGGGPPRGGGGGPPRGGGGNTRGNGGGGNGRNSGYGLGRETGEGHAWQSEGELGAAVYGDALWLPKTVTPQRRGLFRPGSAGQQSWCKDDKRQQQHGDRRGWWLRHRPPDPRGRPPCRRGIGRRPPGGKPGWPPPLTGRESPARR